MFVGDKLDALQTDVEAALEKQGLEGIERIGALIAVCWKIAQREQVSGPRLMQLALEKWQNRSATGGDLYGKRPR